MKCSKCGKKIPKTDEENPLCEDCKKELEESKAEVIETSEETKEEIKEEVEKVEEAVEEKVEEVKEEVEETAEEVKEEVEETTEEVKEEVEEKVEEVKEAAEDVKEEVKEAVEEKKEEVKEKAKKAKKEAKEEYEEAVKEVKEEVQKESKSGAGIVVLIILVIVALLIGAICYEFKQNGSLFSFGRAGNTVGNIMNYGYAVEGGGQLFYSAPDEFMDNTCIYSANMDGSNSKVIYSKDATIISLNYYNGRIYFIEDVVIDSAEDSSQSVENRICSIKTDGSDYQIVNDREFFSYSSAFYIENGNLYYIGTDLNVYKIKLSNNERSLVLENGTGFVGVANGIVYYNTYIALDKDGNVVGTGNEVTTLINNDSKDDPQYTTQVQTMAYNIKTKETYPVVPNEACYSVTPVGDTVYYSNTEGKIYKINPTKGTDKELVYDTEAYYMNIKGDLIYFLEVSPEGKMQVCSVKTDGTDYKTVTSLESSQGTQFINVIGDWVFYTDSTQESLQMVLADRYARENKVVVYDLSIQGYIEHMLGINNATETKNEDGTISMDATIENTTAKVENTVE